MYLVPVCGDRPTRLSRTDFREKIRRLEYPRHGVKFSRVPILSQHDYIPRAGGDGISLNKSTLKAMHWFLGSPPMLVFRYAPDTLNQVQSRKLHMSGYEEK